MIPSWMSGQFADPVQINIRNSGTSFTDQFAASTSYAFQILDGANSTIGFADLQAGGSANTLLLTFTPYPGAVGTTDVIITYFTLNAPMHPVTRLYRFVVADEIVITGDDKFLVDIGAIEAPLDVLVNDSVTNGQLSITSVSVCNAGNTSISADGNIIYFTPNADFAGDTWIQYVACDSEGNCGQENVHVLVRDPNTQEQLELKKFLLNSEVLDILMPFDGFGIDNAPANGTLESYNSFGWTYTPDEGFIGNDTFELSLLNLVTRTYIVTVYQKAANIHARNDKFYVRPGLSVTFNVLNNDLLNYSVSSRTNPGKGYLSEISNGVYTYTPLVGYKGVDKFTYTTCFEDSVYCETATVLLHVTDLEPDNQFSYELQTSKNTPLTFDYPIDYTDFTYIISEEPAHGSLVYYNGVQQINLPCDTIEGYNMIVYEPAAGYTGPDHFEYLYCIQPSNICYLVKVDMNVIDHPETENCPCTVGCVWPGDADRNGRVDMNDLLTLGNKLGDAGLPRNYVNNETWFGQHAEEWTSDAEGTKFLDANGDGTLTSADVDQISDYYYQTNDVVAKDVQQKLPYQFTLIPVQYSLDSGDVVILDIAFGNANYPVLDMKGAKFSINVPAYMLDSSSVDLQFHQDSWLAEGAPYISLAKVPWDGRIDAGFARAKGDGTTGYGVIATVVFIIEDDVEGFKTNNGVIQIPITLNGGSLMNSEGTKFDVDGDEIILTLDPSNNKDQYSLVLYPNPSVDFVELHLNGKSTIEDINILDTQGREIKSISDVNSKHHQIDVSTLPVGLYFIQVQHTGGTLTQLLSVIR